MSSVCILISKHSSGQNRLPDFGQEQSLGVVAPLKSYILHVYGKQRFQTMSIGSVFVNNRTQAVRLPADTRFPDDVKQVNVRIMGKDRVLSPVENTWDSFFMSDQHVSDDFMPERASQEQSERETF